MAPRTEVENWQGHVVSTEKNQRYRKLVRTMMRTINDYDLILPNDKILVAISGGKDSYTLLDILWRAQQRAPFRFEIVAVHLDQVQPGYDGNALQNWLEQFGAPFEIIREDTYKVVTQHVEAGKTYCSLCSRLRRGILYSTAARLGCNKIALGHHLDDSLETLMLNLFFGGKLQAMPAKYTTDDGQFEVIRPLIEAKEADIAAHAQKAGYPIIPCNLCGSQDGLKRQKMKEMLHDLQDLNPNIKSVMRNALKNVRPSHLLDREVLSVWETRPESVRPQQPSGRTTWQNTPEIVAKSSLPILA